MQMCHRETGDFEIRRCQYWPKRHIGDRSPHRQRTIQHLGAAQDVVAVSDDESARAKPFLHFGDCPPAGLLVASSGRAREKSMPFA